MCQNVLRRWVWMPLLAASTALLSRPAAFGQAPDASLGVALRSLASRAGVVFVGQVTSIERSGDVMLIHFRVDQPVLGIAGAITSPFTLREWAGLWPMGESRYYPGLRAMVFLHPPAASGFSSPVDGMEGLVPVIPQGADQDPVLDVRRLDTRILRAAGEPLPDAAHSAITLSEASAVVTHWSEASWTEPTRTALPMEAAPPPAPCSEACATPAPTTGPARLAPSVPHPRRPVTLPVQPQTPLAPQSSLAPQSPLAPQGLLAPKDEAIDAPR